MGLRSHLPYAHVAMLGVPKEIALQRETVDLNTLKEAGFYTFAVMDNVSNSPSNITSSNAHAIIVIPYANNVSSQILFDTESNGGHIWARHSTSQAWKDITDMPSFYKNYATLASLGTALGVIKYNGYAVYDANDSSLKSGIYYLNESSTNTPVSGQPTMLLIMGDGTSKLQLAGTINSDPTYYIRTSSSVGFTAWKQITMA